MDTSLRLPDFLVIGAGKSGTTSLFEWLGTHPGVRLPEVKEPNFFSRDKVWARGLEWYADLFAGAPAGTITGEASPWSTHLRVSPVAAERMAQAVPDARLVYVVRDPIRRMRSQYAMFVRTERERRLFLDAIADVDSLYVTTSLYHSCLAPYLERFAMEQILVVRFEDLTSPPHTAWDDVLDHLGLARQPTPGTVHNQAEGKKAATQAMAFLRRRGFTGLPRWVPEPIRRAGRRRLLRDPDTEPRLLSASAPVPADVLQRISDDAERLARALGRAPMWDLTQPA